MTLTQTEQAEKIALEGQLDNLMQKDWLSPSERAEYDRISDRLSHLENRDDSAPQQFNDHPQAVAPEPTPHLPADPGLSYPAPFTAAPVDHRTGDVTPDLTQPIENAPPVAGQTEFLPLTGNQGYDDTIKAMDKALQTVNNTAFQLNPQDLWQHDSAHLGGPTGPSTLSNLAEPSRQFHEATSKVNDSFEELGNIVAIKDDQTWTERLNKKYQPLIAAAAEGFGTGGRGDKARSSLDESGQGVQNIFNTFHGAITSSRDAIAGLYGTDEHGNRYLDTSRPLNLDTSVSDTANHQIAELKKSTDMLGQSLEGWSLDTDGTSPSGDTTFSGTAPASSAGGNTAGSPGSDLGGSPSSPSGDTPMSAPSAAPPGGGMPQMPQMPGMPQSPIDPNALAGMAQQGAQPHPGDTQLSADGDVPRDGTSAVHADDAKPDAKTKQPDTSTAAGHNVAAMSVPRPGDPVRPGQLGADGKPLDKDGDGKMDDDAKAATKENCDPDGDGVLNNFTVPIDNGERVVDVNMSDPRLAEMMQRMSAADPAHPLSILDAAQLSGLDLKDLGQEIDVMGIQPGDAVEGTDTGMYMGSGVVLTEGGEMKSLEDVMDYNKSDPKVHRLELPELPSTGEVVPDTPAATEASVSPEPAVQVSDEKPIQEPPAQEAPAPPPPPQEAPRQTPPPAAPKASSGGSSSGPEEVAFQGYAMG